MVHVVQRCFEEALHKLGNHATHLRVDEEEKGQRRINQEERKGNFL